ncbi:MAG: acyl-CoA thioesterase, partial [Nitriliruptoraceae bacterium]|nr:acyl-CoA thioesterase [Nitriliruptoraceae bacterium]
MATTSPPDDDATSAADPASLRREDFPVLRAQPTRWHDNDHYGHVNNVVYYAYFDTAVNGYLMEATGTDIRQLDAIGLVVETGCLYLAPVGFPDDLEVGLAVSRLGTSSIAYRLALFRVGDQEPAAVGRFVHVYVDRRTRQNTPIPAVIRSVVAPLTRAGPPRPPPPRGPPRRGPPGRGAGGGPPPPPPRGGGGGGG